MKKAILALFITVAFVSALASKDNGFLTNPTLSPELLEFVDTSCSGAIAGFNKGIQQLIHNIQAKSNQWLVYSDLAALDGSAYHLENLCDPADYELTSKLEAGQTPEQQQACTNLLTMIGSLLDQNQPKTFKSGYEQGLAWSQQALTFGSDIGSGCKISVEVKEYAAAEEEWGWGEENNETGEYNISSDDGSSDDSDVTLGWDMDVFVQKGSHEDCDSDEAQNDSESSEDDSEDNSEDSEDDSDDSEDSDNDDDDSDDQDSSDDSDDDNSDDSDTDSDEDSSDDSNEEEQDGEEWNNGEWTTKAWASEEGTTKAWASGEWSTKAWDNKEWATEDWQNEEWADKDWDSIDWKNVDWSDFKPKSSGNDKPNLRSTFFYEVNPNGNTDSGSDWMNGGYQRYIPPGTGGNPGSTGTGSTGTSGIPGIPGIPSIPGNPGGAKATFLASVEQQANGNPWMDGDYKRYYGGDGGNGVAKSTLFLAAKKTKEVKDDSDENPWDGDYKKYYEGGNDGPKKSNFFYWAI